MVERVLSGVLLIAALGICGCSRTASQLVNLTPQVMPTNPSGIYTLKLLTEQTDESEGKTNIVIGGNVYPMVSDPSRPELKTFDYSIPREMNRAKYYFEMLDGKGRTTATTEVFDLRLTNRYVIEMSSNRAQPGTKVSVLGRGFRSEDTILFGGGELETRFISDSQVEFDVPAMKGGSSYIVKLQTSEGQLHIGDFRVDFSELRSVPSRLVLLEEQTVTVVFSIDRDAPSSGVPLTMDVSNFGLIEFEAVSIEEGTRSISVQITGETAGVGELMVSAPAHNSLTIPVQVDARSTQ